MSDQYTLYLGDCLEYMRGMEAGSVDAVITDPPYGLGIAANPFRQKFAKQAWDDCPAPPHAISEIRRVSTNQIIWGGNYFDLPPARCVLVWDKVQPEDFSSAMIEIAWTNFDRPAKLFRRHVVSFEKFHPTTKPTELMLWCVGNYSRPGDTIFDPFMGSGTTGVACMQLGRNFIGCEIDPKYFEIAKKRIEQAELQPQLFTEKKPEEKQGDLI
jgi:site-specific DNA-methyltransferase (adenine-specific)